MNPLTSDFEKISFNPSEKSDDQVKITKILMLVTEAVA